MIVITVARKPLVGTVAKNVLEHNGFRDSLGGGMETTGETIWWRRKMETP